MILMLISQLIAALVGSAVSSGVQKFILRLVFKADPVFKDLFFILLISSVTLGLLGILFSFLLGGFNLLQILLLIAGYFLIPAFVSDRVKTVRGDRISYGQAFGAQVLQTLLFAAVIWIIFQTI